MSELDHTAAVATRSVSVIMERTALSHRWVSEKWEAKGIVCEPVAADGPYRVLADGKDRTELLYPDRVIRLQRDEAEGYYLNITSTSPRVFVLWRMEDNLARPHLLTVSYHEGARWMDSDEKVDGVPLPHELLPWIAEFVARHYRPEPPKAKRYASNKDRGRMGV